jgi:hypothetical protein
MFSWARGDLTWYFPGVGMILPVRENKPGSLLAFNPSFSEHREGAGEVTPGHLNLCQGADHRLPQCFLSAGLKGPFMSTMIWPIERNCLVTARQIILVESKTRRL